MRRRGALSDKAAENSGPDATIWRTFHFSRPETVAVRRL